MTVATAFAVSWNPLTNSKPSATISATPRSTKGRTESLWTKERSCSRLEPAYPTPITSTTPKTSMPSLPGERESFWSKTDVGAVAILSPQIEGRLRLWACQRGHYTERLLRECENGLMRREFHGGGGRSLVTNGNRPQDI